MLHPAGKKAECLIINAVECEPYLTADYRVMLEKGSSSATRRLSATVPAAVSLDAQRASKRLPNTSLLATDAVHSVGKAVRKRGESEDLPHHFWDCSCGEWEGF